MKKIDPHEINRAVSDFFNLPINTISANIKLSAGALPVVTARYFIDDCKKLTTKKFTLVPAESNKTPDISELVGKLCDVTVAEGDLGPCIGDSYLFRFWRNENDKTCGFTAKLVSADSDSFKFQRLKYPAVAFFSNKPSDVFSEDFFVAKTSSCSIKKSSGRGVFNYYINDLLSAAFVGDDASEGDVFDHYHKNIKPILFPD